MTHNNSDNTRRNTNNNSGSFLNLRCRYWFFTINSYDSNDIEKLKSENFIGLTFQDEIGASGNHHLQGVIAYKTQRTGKAMKNKWPKGHFEKCKNIAASKRYCNKENTWGGNYKYSKWDNTITVDIQPGEVENVDTSYTELTLWEPKFGTDEWISHKVIPEFKTYLEDIFPTIKKYEKEDKIFWLALKQKALN